MEIIMPAYKVELCGIGMGKVQFSWTGSSKWWIVSFKKKTELD